MLFLPSPIDGLVKMSKSSLFSKFFRFTDSMNSRTLLFSSEAGARNATSLDTGGNWESCL